MSGGFGRLASNDSSELWRFDTYALGYAGLVLAEVGILTNIIALGILFCSLLGNLHLHIGSHTLEEPENFEYEAYGVMCQIRSD